MNLEQLEALCQEAARDLVERGERPLEPAVVVPLPDATRITALPDFPEDDAVRSRLLERFAADVMRPANAPCYGFVAEAEAEAGAAGGRVDVVVVVFGARRHHPRITAAPLIDGELGPFAEAEPLEPAAMPFLAPLQQAAEAAEAPDRPLGDLG